MDAIINGFKKEFTIKLDEKSETVLTIKFEDPRDALKYLANGINNLTQDVVEEVFEYVEYGYSCNLFNIKETYQYLVLCFQVENFITYPHEWFIKLNRFSTISEIKKASDVIEKYLEALNRSNRISHQFAVTNTWKVWNNTQYNIRKTNLDSNENIIAKEDIKRSSVSQDELFCSLEGYKGKEVHYEVGFLLSRRLWRVVFTDGSWLIASNHGNGWYRPFTKLNSYKITEGIF